jgi:hypothetical protein
MEQEYLRHDLHNKHMLLCTATLTGIFMLPIAVERCQSLDVIAQAEHKLPDTTESAVRDAPTAITYNQNPTYE